MLLVVTRRLAILGATLLAAPPKANSADLPLSSLPEDSRVRELVENFRRPKVRALPRRRLNQDFAVLLMRTSYGVADELDFMPMDEFQKDQFLFRQREWDVYRTQLTVMQGDLTDPAYFDFISFCQYATLARGMRSGRIIFEELVDANGTSVVVSRDPSLPQANALLPAAHSDRVGDRLLDWCLDRYDANVRPEILPAGGATATQLFDGLKRLSDIFELNDYALTSSMTLMGTSGVTWTLVAPANLWSAQVLQVRGDFPSNDFELKAALAYLRRCGVPAVATTKFEQGTQVTHEIRWLSAALV